MINKWIVIAAMTIGASTIIAVCWLTYSTPEAVDVKIGKEGFYLSKKAKDDGKPD